MAKIISFLTQKGGAGKTQCTVLLAGSLAAMNYKVLVIDMDDQQSITTARRFDEPAPPGVFQLESITGSNRVLLLSEKLPAWDQIFDFILIDLPGKLDIHIPVSDQLISRVLMYLDFIFVPFVAGNYNLESTLSFINIAQKIEAVRRSMERPLYLIGFVNMYRKRSRVNDYLLDDIKRIQERTNIRFMGTMLHNYTSFADIDTITSIYNKNSKQSDIINLVSWINEIKTITNGKASKKR
jgi:cellulose biosynthesis protein BcsQ